MLMHLNVNFGRRMHQVKEPRKKHSKHNPVPRVPRAFEALAELTSSDIIKQVKDGMSRIAPFEMEDDSSEEGLPSSQY
jgi:hypothetical protein